MGGLRRLRRVTVATLVCGAVALTAGCLSADQRVEAEQLALGDARLAGFLAAHPHRVVEVREPAEAVADAVVDVHLDTPAGAEAWPLDVCGTGVDQDVVGIRWLVDLVDDEIVAVAPIWGANKSCFENV